MVETDDTALVKQCLAGQTNAFTRLVEKYQKPIFNVALKMVEDYEDARDIAQTVFIRAYEKLESFDPKYKFFSWIYRMAINQSINFINQRRPVAELDAAIASTEKTPDERQADSELSEQIQDALMDLHVDSRVVIILRHFQNCTYEEMAYILDIHEKTVKSRLFSARQKLKDILQRRGVVTDA